MASTNEFWIKQALEKIVKSDLTLEEKSKKIKMPAWWGKEQCSLDRFYTFIITNEKRKFNWS